MPRPKSPDDKRLDPRVTLRFDRPTYERLRRLAKAQDRTISDVIRAGTFVMLGMEPAEREARREAA